MPYIPHTDTDLQDMLSVLGVSSIDDCFAEWPQFSRTCDIGALPDGLSEQQVSRLMVERYPPVRPERCFLGAGAYDHYVPAIVTELMGRGEFYTAYTPYQAEASQGSLQMMFEYQTMMCRLMNMEASNASVYDGATALVEAVLMACRIKKRGDVVLVPRSLHPHYQQTLHTILSVQGITIRWIDDVSTGGLTPELLSAADLADVVAVVFPQPNVFGVLTDVDALTDVAHDHNLLVIGVVNPILMSSVKEPGSWGTRGADIVCGEGQPLGIPLSLGGPYFGFLCTRLSYVRQLPGRIVGETVDSEGQTGYVLTLQAREQHIRRAKATSNICTNQGLMVTMATIYLHAMGPSGVQQVALESYERGHELSDILLTLPGVTGMWDRPFWHERVLCFDRPIETVCSALQADGFFPGVALGAWYPELSHCLLVCATETKTTADITALAAAMAQLEEGVDELR